MWVERPRLAHTTSQEPLFSRGSHNHWYLLCTRVRHRDGVDMPDAGLHPHREAMHKQHAQSQGHRAVCPSANHMSTKWHHRAKPDRAQPQQRKHIWGQSTIWRGHTRPNRSTKRGKGLGTSAKSSVLILTCVPLLHLVLSLSGCACSGTPTKATRCEAGDIHDSGFAAIRVSPCQTSNANFAMAQ